MGGQSFTITSIPVAAAGTIPPFQSNGNLTRSFNVSFGGTIVPISDSGSYHSIRIALSRRIYLRSERSGILVPVEGGKELKFMHVPYKRNPIRCQFTTVRGVTKTRGFLHPDQNVLNATQNSLCRAVNRVRGRCACKASSCRRRAKFSRARSSRERKELTIHPRRCRSDTIMVRIVSELSEFSFALSHSFCRCTTFWRDTGPLFLIRAVAALV